MIPYVLKSAEQLKKAGVDFIVLPCNTLHEILPILKKEINLPFIDLVEETVKVLKDYSKVGILSSKRTKESKIYDNLLNNVEIIYPNQEEQDRISEIIIKIIKQASINLDKDYINKVILNLKDQGAEKIVLACTDLANIIDLDNSIIDTQKILIQSILKKMKE